MQTLQCVGDEHYKIIARNKMLIFSTNKPIVERWGLKDFTWMRKLITGDLACRSAHDLIMDVLEVHLRGKINLVVACFWHKDHILRVPKADSQIHNLKE